MMYQENPHLDLWPKSCLNHSSIDNYHCWSPILILNSYTENAFAVVSSDRIETEIDKIDCNMASIMMMMIMALAVLAIWLLCWAPMPGYLKFETKPNWIKIINPLWESISSLMAFNEKKAICVRSGSHSGSDSSASAVVGHKRKNVDWV